MSDSHFGHDMSVKCGGGGGQSKFYQEYFKSEVAPISVVIKSEVSLFLSIITCDPPTDNPPQYTVVIDVSFL